MKSNSPSFQPSALRLVEDELDDELPIVEGKDDFSFEVSAPSQFMGLIIGRQGKTKQSIEQLSGCRLNLPAKNSSEETVTIRGPTRKAVIQANERLSIILAEARRKAQFTHFLSIPLGIDPKIREAALKLQNDFHKIATEKAIRGYDASIAMAAPQLHLTVFLLKLLTQSEVKKAADILQSLAPKIYDALETRSLVLQVKGLEIMNDDPSACDVLYVKVSENNNEKRLLNVCALILHEFEKHGLVDDSQQQQQGRPVKLHATILNTRYRQNSSGSRERQSFDARPFLELDNNKTDLGSVKINALHLSQRGVNDSNGFYHCVAKVTFP
jgi:activating signal cointegrator complex subunit 1